MNCPKCNSEVPNNAHFCPKCNTRFDKIISNNTGINKPIIKYPIFLIILIFITYSIYHAKYDSKSSNEIISTYYQTTNQDIINTIMAIRNNDVTCADDVEKITKIEPIMRKDIDKIKKYSNKDLELLGLELSKSYLRPCSFHIKIVAQNESWCGFKAS